MIGEDLSELGGNFCAIWWKIMFSKFLFVQHRTACKICLDSPVSLFVCHKIKAGKGKYKNRNSPIPSQAVDYYHASTDKHDNDCQ